MAKHSDKSTQAIIEAANEWLLVIHEQEVSAADEQAFVTWLRESPVHVREYLKAEAVFATLEGIDSAKYIDVQALLESDDSVVDLLGPDLSAPGRTRRLSMRRPWPRRVRRTASVEYDAPLSGPRRRVW